MDVEMLKARLAELNDEIRTVYSDHENEVYPIFDGVFNLAEYFAPGNRRVMWLMKEAYESGDREGDWSYPDFYKNDYEGFYSRLIRGKSNSTWQPIVYSSYGIHNGYSLWDDIADISEDPEIVKVIGKIAVVNIQKLPSLIGSRTNMLHIHEAYAKNKSVILKQIELLAPHVVICANVFDVIKNDFDLQKLGDFDSVHCYKSGETIFLDAYHPAQTILTREDYVNGIVTSIKYCMQP